jgi:signal transduction histidine kinase
MLARQLLIGFIAVIVPSTVLLGAVTFYSVRSMARVSNELAEISRSDEAVTDLNMTLTQAGAPLDSFLHKGDSGSRRRFEDVVREAETKLQSCGAVPCHSSSQTPARMAAGLKPVIDQVKREGRRVFENKGDGADARVEAVHRIVADAREVTEPMLKAIHLRAGELQGEADSVIQRAWVLTLALTGAIVLAGAATAMVIAGRIARPLNDLLLGVRRVMAGDWSYQASVTQKGEIGELASAFNAMVRELRERRAQLEDNNRTLEQRVRQRTEELRQKEQKLVQSEKLASLGLLAAGVAHELNNPLTSIVMNANLMMEEMDEGAPLYKELKTIDDDAGRCRRIIEDLRAFARVRQVERVSTGVDTVVGQALSSSAHELSRRNIFVQCDLAPGLPMITWDPARVVQVLTNLLVNAAQAIGQGGRVVIRARRDEDWLRLEVEDDGAGIPAAHQTRIFDPFFTTKPDGTGLGLSISHGIVNEHGGRIEVESRSLEDAEPGGRTGTTVRVILPIAEAAG